MPLTFSMNVLEELNFIWSLLYRMWTLLLYQCMIDTDVQHLVKLSRLCIMQLKCLVSRQNNWYTTLNKELQLSKTETLSTVPQPYFQSLLISCNLGGLFSIWYLNTCDFGTFLTVILGNILISEWVQRNKIVETLTWCKNTYFQHTIPDVTRKRSCPSPWTSSPQSF